MNFNKYMIIQLKTFGYDQATRQPFKKIPKLQIEEQVDTILLGKLNLRAIIYHNGDSPAQGHYVACVKDGDTWYTCNDNVITLGVKLHCDPNNRLDLLIPYLLIYEKNLESEISIPSNVSHPTEIQESDQMITADDSNVDFEFSVGISNCTQINENVKVINADIATVAGAMKRKADEMDYPDVIKKPDAHVKGMNVSAINSKSKITNTENQRMKRELILKEIELKKKEVLDAKEEKLNVKQLLSNELQLLSSQNIDPEDPVYKEKINKSGGQLNIYNKILKDAKTVIKSKEAALKEIDDIGFDLDDRKLDVSSMNRDSLLKELDIQSKKLTYAENQRKERESIEGNRNEKQRGFPCQERKTQG